MEFRSTAREGAYAAPGATGALLASPDRRPRSWTEILSFAQIVIYQEGRANPQHMCRISAARKESVSVL
jgi:hypothetical protein